MTSESEEKKLTPVNDALNEGRGKTSLYVMGGIVVLFFLFLMVAGLVGIPRWPVMLLGAVALFSNWLFTREDPQFVSLYLLSRFQPDRYIPGKGPKEPMAENLWRRLVRR